MTTIEMPIYNDPATADYIRHVLNATPGIDRDRRVVIEQGLDECGDSIDITLIEMASLLETMNEPEFMEDGPRRCGVEGCNCEEVARRIA